MVNISNRNGKMDDIKEGERITNSAMFCSCGKFPNSSIITATKQKENIGKMTIGDALHKLRTELSEMQEQDKGIFKQLMKVSANVDRLRREIRLEEEAKRKYENEDDDSDTDDELNESEEIIHNERVVEKEEAVATKSIASKQLIQNEAISHQRCDSGIMADDSDNEVLSNSLNVSQRRQMFENGHVTTQPKIQMKDSAHALSKCTVRVVDVKNVQRVNKSMKSQPGDKGELVRLGKFQVLPQNQVNSHTDNNGRQANQIRTESNGLQTNHASSMNGTRQLNPTRHQNGGRQVKQVGLESNVRQTNHGRPQNDTRQTNGVSPRSDDSPRSIATRKKGLKDGLLLDISETGELKLHNNIKDVQKTAKARHSEVRNAVFATLNSVQTRKQIRSSNPDLLDDDNNNKGYRIPLRDHEDNYIPHSRSSDGILNLQRNNVDIPRSRSLDGILDADDDFVDYDDGTKNEDDTMPFRRYSSCNYGNRNPVQVGTRASGRIGYSREAETSNHAMENDAKAYFDALKSKKVMIRSISSASII